MPKITVSVPCRIHIGGAQDMKPLALYLESQPVTTVTMALDLRMYITVHDFQEGLVRIVNEGIDVVFKSQQLPLDGPLGLICSVISILGVSGIEVCISYDFPIRSGLGGSGALVVGLITALDRWRRVTNSHVPMSNYDICILAHDIEDGSYSITGLQDQCAATFGSIYQWFWTYTKRDKFTGKELLYEYSELEERLVIAYIGQEHSSIDVCSKLINTYKNDNLRYLWFDLCSVSNLFAVWLPAYNWSELCKLVEEQATIYNRLLPELMGPIAGTLESISKKYPTGFNKLGIGDSGCCWVLCSTPEVANTVRQLWSSSLRNVKTAKILPSKITSKGVLVEEVF